MAKATRMLAPKIPPERMAAFMADASAQARAEAGIVEDQLECAERLQKAAHWAAAIAIAIGAGALWRAIGNALLLALIIPVPGMIPYLLWESLSKHLGKLLSSARIPGWIAYQREYKALLNVRVECYKREVIASVDWWKGLDGHAFEREVARLLRQHGFDVEETPASGDGGVDIVSRDTSGSIAIQCKRYAKPVGPAVIRELYGVVMSGGYSLGILAVTGGVTKGVTEFAQGKPLRILGLDQLVALQVELNETARASASEAAPA